MTYPYYNLPCAKPWAGLAQNLRDAGFKLPQIAPQTRKLNLNRRALERSPYTVYIHQCSHDGMWVKLQDFIDLKKG